MFKGGKPPVPIPKVDRAWHGMEELLNKQLPVMHTPAPSSWWLNIKVAVLGIVATGMSIFLQGGNESLQGKRVPPAEITKQTNNDTILSATDSLKEIFSVSDSSHIDSSNGLSGLFSNQNIIYLQSANGRVVTSQSLSVNNYSQRVFTSDREKGSIVTSQLSSANSHSQQTSGNTREKRSVVTSQLSSANSHSQQTSASTHEKGRVATSQLSSASNHLQQVSANDRMKVRATTSQLSSANSHSQHVSTSYREKRRVAASKLSSVSNHSQQVFATNNSEASTAINKNKQQSATNNSKNRGITYKNKRYSKSPSVTNQSLSGEGITSHENELHIQPLSETEQSTAIVPQRISLTTLPLRSGKSQGLTHTNMRVFLPEVNSKGGPSGLSTWCLWLQLNVPVPLSDSKYYSAGPKGNNAFYRNLIPSLRVEKKIGKSSLSMDLRPFSSALLPLDSGQHSYDTLNLNRTKKRMLKQFGPEVTLQYHYPVYRHWYISAGIGASWWQKAIFEQTNSRDTLAPTTGIITASKDDWKNYSRFRLTSTIELYYETPKWQIGVRTGIPLNKYSNDSAYIRKPLQVEFMLRRRIKW
ncbi:hypothetical protein SAMN05518672_104241 [Chitinophaga sp. CF118]|nr:hypothetical protein SAMN05518672_104241 [Chitinophaga sp. CF118]